MPLIVLVESIYGLGGDIVCKISRWPSWISERKDLSSSESLCHCSFKQYLFRTLNIYIENTIFHGTGSDKKLKAYINHLLKQFWQF